MNSTVEAGPAASLGEDSGGLEGPTIIAPPPSPKEDTGHHQGLGGAPALPLLSPEPPAPALVGDEAEDGGESAPVAEAPPQTGSEEPAAEDGSEQAEMDEERKIWSFVQAQATREALEVWQVNTARLLVAKWLAVPVGDLFFDQDHVLAWPQMFSDFERAETILSRGRQMGRGPYRF
ncbi:hypothetical protein S7711_10398 [Stachybotrys chartarum IBT 7711]|uniref:Uncharacterized protein n=1 Tax=Stachybotrys chartarum (strain CBS 109288 / IBT 7711) TaxID=1280523 RepID=A0A084B420_STACB|nr:hypothetical protein S7711_10398 [Stachybotrys chartarum IBT 7711]KFA52416.1 hypothetical protein S40293_11019 [Stachybotrys chartarum IBT 40293]